MKRAAIYSLILHFAILLFVLIGFSNPFRDNAVKPLMMIEVQEIRTVSTAPKLSPEAAEEPKPEKKVETPKEPPKTEPAKPQPQKSEPKPQPAKPEPPKPEAKEEVKEEPAPLPKKKPQEKKPEPPKEKKEEAKKTPPKAEVNLSKKKPSESKDKDAKAKKEESFDSILDSVDKESAKSTNTSKGAPAEKVDSVLSTTEESLLASHMRKCWIVPAGAQGAKDLVVDIDLEVGPDFVVKKAEVADKSRMASDPFFRAAAESARRAVLDPKCNPLPIPPAKYEHFKKFTYAFNPKEMFSR